MTKHAYSNFFTKTNFSFGDDPAFKSSRYRADYTLDAIRKPRPSTDFHATSPSLPAINPRPVQKISITFGNDNDRTVSTYQEFTAQGHQGSQRRMSPVQPPEEAQILPPPSDMKKFMSTHTSVRDDYNYFGQRINRTAYDDSQRSLDWVKAVNTCDSVGRTMHGKGRIYWTGLPRGQHRLEARVCHDHWDHTHPVRADCIWKNMNTGSWRGSFQSEMRQNYSPALVRMVTQHSPGFQPLSQPRAR